MKASKKIVGAIIFALALMVLPAASAQAESFTMSIDNAIMDLGGLSGVRAIDSQATPPDPPATLSGDLTDSTVNVPKAGFVFPTKSAEVSAGINADIDMEANEDITGTFEAGTGKLVLNASLKAVVQVLSSTCTISPIVVEFSTDNASPYLGQEFASGIEGDGVFGDSWTSLPSVTGGGFCNIVAGLVAGPGGIAMSHGVHDFQTCETDPGNSRCGDVPIIAPQLAPTLNSAPLSSTSETTANFTFAQATGETQPVTGFECKLDSGAFATCDSGSQSYSGLAQGAHTFTVRATNSAGAGPEASHAWTVTGSNGGGGNDGTARLAALQVAPKAKAVKRGKKATVTVKVRNAGDAAARGVRVCVTAPKKLVKVKKCVNLGQIAAGKTKNAKFKVTVQKKAKKGKKAVLKFRATSGNAGNKAGKSTVRIR